MNNRETKLKIASHEIVNEEYLRLEFYSANNPCGSIDFIKEKVNFNISCRANFFKGMEMLKNIKMIYEDEKLAFKFRNNKSLVLHCPLAIYSIISAIMQVLKLKYKQQKP